MNWKDELKKRWYLWDYDSNYQAYTTCQEEVIDFISSLLKQQREVCAEQMVDRDIIDRNSFAYKGILNAPEPTGEIK